MRFVPTKSTLILLNNISSKRTLIGKENSAFSSMSGRAIKLRLRMKETSNNLKQHVKRVIDKLSRNSEPIINSPNSSNTQNSKTSTHTKVVTDIDDTIVSSGGVKILGFTIGGVDNQYKRGQLYPGAIQFAFELSHAQLAPSTTTNEQITQSLSLETTNKITTTTSSSQYISVSGAKVSVLTARAKELKYLLRLKESGKVCTAYRKVGQAQGVQDWGIGDVYYGSIIEWIFQERKGLRKFRNFELLFESDLKASRESDRQHRYILIGDTGEKDEEAGERIASKYGADNIRAIFLHTVYDLHTNTNTNNITTNINTKSHINTSDDMTTVPSSSTHKTNINKHSRLPADRVVNGVPICYFRTYIGAANKAYELGLISEEALKRVAMTALSELRENEVTSAVSMSSIAALKIRNRARLSLARMYRYSGNSTMSRYYLKKWLKRSAVKSVGVVHTQWSRWSELMLDASENEALRRLLSEEKEEEEQRAIEENGNKEDRPK